MGQLFWLSPNFWVSHGENPENRKIFEKWAYFSRKILKNGYPFLPKSPLKMGTGLEARAAHPCPTQIWVPPGCNLISFNEWKCLKSSWFSLRSLRISTILKMMHTLFSGFFFFLLFIFRLLQANQSWMISVSLSLHHIPGQRQTSLEPTSSSWMKPRTSPWLPMRTCMLKNSSTQWRLVMNSSLNQELNSV